MDEAESKSFTGTRKPVSLGVEGPAAGVDSADRGESKRSE